MIHNDMTSIISLIELLSAGDARPDDGTTKQEAALPYFFKDQFKALFYC